MDWRTHFAARLTIYLKFTSLTLLALSAGGCLSSQHQQSQSTLPPAAKSPPDITPASTRPDAMDADSANPADVLAQRTASYSQEMAAAIAKRASESGEQGPASPADSATAQPSAGQASTGQHSPAQPSPAQPSLVQWGDTSDTHLSLLPGYLMRPDAPAPAPAPVEALQSSANTQASQMAPQLASMRSGAVSNSAAVVSAEPVNRDGSAESPRTSSASTSEGNGQPADENSAQGPSGTVDSASNDSASNQSLAALNAKLAKRVQEYPHDVSAHFDYQLMQFVMDQPVPELSSISTLPDEDREMISAVMDGLSNYRNNLRADNNMLLSHKVRPLLEMADRLRALADLTIPTLALCREVRGFGNYEPFDGDPPHFAAGVDHPMILYCEVQNFSSQLSDGKMWQTSMVQDAVLYTEGGMSVWTDKTQEVNDSARNRRQDFFIVQRMRLPSTLPIGRYLLKVTIEDKQSHHVAEATQPLVIVAE